MTFPNGETLLVDGGGRLSFGDDANGDFRPDTRTVGESVVSQVLWYKGYSQVDHILATQGVTARHGAARELPMSDHRALVADL